MPYEVFCFAVCHAPDNRAPKSGVWFADRAMPTYAAAQNKALALAGAMPALHVCIVQTDGTIADLLAKRAALAAPRGYKLATDN